jgi:predicted RNA binding protein YcfA (HicA-like mRNA interferase family)
MKPMKRRDVDRLLAANGCRVTADKGRHTTWECPCGAGHKAYIPRHQEVTAGVLRDTVKRLACLQEGWLQ